MSPNIVRVEVACARASQALGKFQQKLDSRVGQQRLSPESRALLRDMAESLRFQILDLQGAAA